MTTFQCPACGKSLQTKGEVRSQVSCPACGTRFAVGRLAEPAGTVSVPSVPRLDPITFPPQPPTPVPQPPARSVEHPPAPRPQGTWAAPKPRSRPAPAGTPASRAPTRASLLLAMMCYTRGLWSLFFLWRRLFVGPYRCRSLSLRMDDDFVKQHLGYALHYAAGWTLAQLTLLGMYWATGDNWTGGLLMLSVLVQWWVFPWLIGRGLWQAHAGNFPSNAQIESPPHLLVVTEENGGQIPDLGFLLREANFSVDSAKRWQKDGQPSPPQPVPPPVQEEFYQRLEVDFAGVPDVVTQRTIIRGAEQIQPGSKSWRNSQDGPAPSLAPAKADNQRMLIFCQRPDVDGLTTVELEVREVKGHLSFNVRQRWLPPLQRRIARLALTALQLPWWRGGVVPGLLLLIVILSLLPAGWMQSALTPVARSMREAIALAQDQRQNQQALARMERAPEGVKELEQLHARAAELRVRVQDLIAHWKEDDSEGHRRVAQVVSAVPEERQLELFLQNAARSRNPEIRQRGDALEREQEDFQKAFNRALDPYKEAGDRGGWFGRLCAASVSAVCRRIENNGRLVVAVLVAMVVALLPLLLFLAVALWRLLRLAWGAVAAAGHCYLNVVPLPSLRLACAAKDIVDDESLRWSIAYMQLVEEMLTNRIIDVLHDHGIDTNSIRAEMSIFINQGVYMTGGNLQAENLVVGRGGVISNLFGGGGHVRRGQVALMHRPVAKA